MLVEDAENFVSNESQSSSAIANEGSKLIGIETLQREILACSSVNEVITEVYTHIALYLDSIKICQLRPNQPIGVNFG